MQKVRTILSNINSGINIVILRLNVHILSTVTHQQNVQLKDDIREWLELSQPAGRIRGQGSYFEDQSSVSQKVRIIHDLLIPSRYTLEINKTRAHTNPPS